MSLEKDDEHYTVYWIRYLMNSAAMARLNLILTISLNQILKTLFTGGCVRFARYSNTLLCVDYMPMI